MTTSDPFEMLRTSQEAAASWEGMHERQYGILNRAVADALAAAKDLAYTAATQPEILDRRLREAIKDAVRAIPPMHVTNTDYVPQAKRRPNAVVDRAAVLLAIEHAALPTPETGLPEPADVPIEGSVSTAVQNAWNDHHQSVEDTQPETGHEHQPGDPHQYRIECEVCGQRGQVNLSVEPQRAAALPTPEPAP